uniref:Uncharacterized protein n=1 Tax=Romanomermis culicivorax TaxID=13658 RepID=A0A915IKP3_ROMCU
VDDWAPLAKFYYADENLNSIAAELDCFDGAKDPEKNQRLINQLRHCQDRIIQIIEEVNRSWASNFTEWCPIWARLTSIATATVLQKPLLSANYQ